MVNSFASSVTARNTVVVHRRLARDNDVEVVETNRRGHATRYAADAARRGFDVVIGYGGDGTLNEVATGIAGTDAALGVLPGGSTNVFARTLGLPNDPIAAVDLLANGIDAGDIRPIGLGRVNGRFFCFHTGIGYDAAVVRKVERHASMKRWFGHPLFISAALTTWASGYDRHHPTSRSTPATDAASTTGTSRSSSTPTRTPTSATARSTSRRAATLDRGLVAVTFRTLRVRRSCAALSGALRGGGVRPSEHLDEWTDLDELVAWHDEPFPYQVDGDYLGETSRLEFAHVPDAVRLVSRRRHRRRDPTHLTRVRCPQHGEARDGRYVGHVRDRCRRRPTDELAHALRVVARPRVDGDPGRVTLVDGDRSATPTHGCSGAVAAAAAATRRRRPARRPRATPSAMPDRSPARVDHRQVERRDQPSRRSRAGERRQHDDGDDRPCGRSPVRAASFLISMLTRSPAVQATSASRSVGMCPGRSRRVDDR